MGIRNLEQLLEQERGRLGAASCTFYLRDPLWPFEYRLVCMPGVRYPEAMHGFVLTDQARQFLCSGDQEIFCTEARLLRSEDTPATLELTIDPELVFLFQDFVGREGIESFARLLHVSGAGSVDAVLFINFNQPTEFSGELKTAVRGVLRQAEAFLPGVRNDLRSLDGEYLAESMKILHPAQEFASAGLGWKRYFEQMLRLCLEALQIPAAEGLGTIHLYEPEKGVLKLAASWGNAPNIGEAQMQLASKGQGVISWVALKQKSILVESMGTSEFRHIKVEVNREVRSELAVPMIVDGDLIGVFNLESVRERAFRPGSVRSIWYAANSAAVVYQLKTRADASQRLLSICEAATKDQEGVQQALKDIAEVLAQTLSADGCDLWHYNSFLGRFDIAGATYQHFVPSLRPAGWSSYIRKNRQSIWLSNFSADRKFSCRYWSGQQWEQSPSPGDMPPDVNTMVLKNGMQAELGMPILVGGACVGVAWIKYKEHRQPPTQKRMSEVFRAGSQAGLVLESVQRQVERPDRDQLAKISEQVSVFSTSRALDFGPLPLEGYIVHRPFHSHACGDFHVASQVDTSVVGLLIGDGEGKAVSGLLNALPMITGFEAFGHGSSSTRHVIEKLRALCRKLGLGGTALYWTFTLAGGDVWLAMTSAGHEVPILVRHERSIQVRTVPPDPSSSRALGVPLGNDLEWPPQVEHQEQLMPGDVLIAYTDGVSDGICQGPAGSRKDPTNTIMGIALEQDRDCTCREMAEAIMAAAERACPLLDDATVCVVRHKARSGS